jgi:hypothetical protein
MAALAAHPRPQTPPAGWCAWCSWLLLQELGAGRCGSLHAAQMLLGAAALALGAGAGPGAGSSGGGDGNAAGGSGGDSGIDGSSGASTGPSVADRSDAKGSSSDAGGAAGSAAGSDPRPSPGQVEGHTLDAAVIAACAQELAKREFAVPTPTLLAACRAAQRLGWQPAGSWLQGLEACLGGRLPAMAGEEMVAVLQLLACWGHAPGSAWVGVLALVSQARVPRLSLGELAGLAAALQAAGLQMPAQWVAAVLQRAAALAQQQVAAQGAGGSLGGGAAAETGSSPAGAASTSGSGEGSQWAQLRAALRDLHADLPSVAALQPGLKEQLHWPL